MKRAKLSGLLAKIEAVEGTDAVPVVGTDGIQLEEHIWNSTESDYLERNLRENATGNRMGRHGGAQPAGGFGKVTATVAVKGAGAAYAAAARPELDVLLRMAGLQAVVTATAGTEKIVYTPIDDGHESATVYAYAGGSLFKLLGCRARITGISMIPAQIARITFEILGVHPANPTDIALPAITYPRRAVKPPVVRAEDLTLDGYGARYKTFAFNQNLNLVAAPRAGAPDGHAGYGITDYDPQITAQIDTPDKGAFNPWALERLGSEFAWDAAVGAAQYNRMSLAGSAGQVIRVPQQEADGFAMIELNIRCLHGAADPAFTFTFD